MELYPDLLIQRLTMKVDPSDSSYMPSVVVISAGDSIQIVTSCVHLRIYNLFCFLLKQHWIRMELYPDLLIQRLTMKVDPSDSSYMPSVVVISAGDSIQMLKEIKTVHISATDSVVTLLEDAPEASVVFVLII